MLVRVECRWPCIALAWLAGWVAGALGACAVAWAWGRVRRG